MQLGADPRSRAGMDVGTLSLRTLRQWGCSRLLKRPPCVAPQVGGLFSRLHLAESKAGLQTPILADCSTFEQPAMRINRITFLKGQRMSEVVLHNHRNSDCKSRRNRVGGLLFTSVLG